MTSNPLVGPGQSGRHWSKEYKALVLANLEHLSIIEATARKLVKIESDLDEFDGDRRGMYHARREAVCDLADLLPGSPKLRRDE